MRGLIGWLISGVFIFGAFTAVYQIYENVANDQLVADTFTEMGEIAINMQTLYRGTPGRYGSAALADSDLITYEIAPPSTHNGAALRNQFGGNIDISGNDTTFFMVFDAIPQAQCVALISRFTSAGYVEALRIAETSVTHAAATDNQPPLSVAQAQTACATATNAIRIEAG